MFCTTRTVNIYYLTLLYECLHVHKINMNLCRLRNYQIIVRKKHAWIKPSGYDTGINVYNCIVKDKVKLILRNKNFAAWYTCGPTVYDSSHIGHASCYVKLDIIQRILKNYFNINVVTAMNITDVDDKIIQKSNETGMTSTELAKHFEKEFWEDMETLNIQKPNVVLRVTDNMNHIIDYIKQLLEKKNAYVADDGSVYFDLSVYNGYGKLQNIGEVLSRDEMKYKKTEMDFALWKAAKPNEPFWKSEWSLGRPGWHIECSSLASTIFGSAVDIHAGGIDLRFPHHENEEAQSCAYYTKSQWVNYWFHTGHLHLKNAEKMSKSLKNTVSIREMLKSCNSDVFRIACLMSHYRSNMEYSEEYVRVSENLLQHYKNFIETCNAFFDGQLKCTLNEEILLSQLNDTVQKIHDALLDDFDTATIVKVLNSLIKTTNKMLNTAPSVDKISANGAGYVMAILNLVVNTFKLFGLNLQSQIHFASNLDVSNIMDILIHFRQNVRLLGISKKDNSLLSLCDDVRTELKKIGITVNDRGKMSSWIK